MELHYCKDRDGNVVEKKTFSEDSLNFLYKNSFGRRLFKILSSKGFANFERWVLSSGFSSVAIDAFIKKNNIELKDYVPERYKTFNDFFTRQIRYDRRLMDPDPSLLISPADGRATAYPIDEASVFKIKNSLYSVGSLLKDSGLAKEFKGGWFVLIRLSVDNYHRYAYCCDGIKSVDINIGGMLHTVNPMVYDFAKVYVENSRTYCTITTPKGIRLVQMEVGAMSVGRITNILTGEGEVHRGGEKGYFEFGGSSIVLLIPKGSYTPDEDIVRNTAEGFETEVKFRESIGRLID